MPIHGYTGNVITANPTAPTVSVATGVWTTEQQLQAIAAGNWPGYEYPISRSLRFNSADTAYLSRTGGTSTNRKIHTFSFWTKYSVTGGTGVIASAGSDDNNREWLGFDSNKFSYQIKDSGSFYDLVTTQVFRDPSAWYHLMVAVDTTQATSSNRVKMYINGVQVTAFGTATYPPQNDDLFFNDSNGGTSYIGVLRGFVSSTFAYNGYLTEFYFIDGQALTPSSFGLNDPETGIWSPKAYSGTYGTNGFFLNFSDNSNTTATTLGKDYSGNGNNWTPNNFSVTAGVGNDSMVDSPSPYGTDTGAGGEVRGNYCTLNSLFTNQTGVASGASGTAPTISNGNLTTTAVAGSAQTSSIGTMGVFSGKWYFEYTPTAVNGTGDIVGFVCVFDGNLRVAGYRSSGVIYRNGSTSSGYSTWTNNDVIGIALDIDGSTVSCYKNNTLQATLSLTNAITDNCFPLVWFRDASGAGSVNFGQRAFAYTAPSGFKALCTQNLPTPTIGATSTTQANDYFDTTLYTGTDATQSITNSGSMQPDFVWVKARNGAYNHYLYDVIRGSTNALRSSTTGAESQAGDSTLVLQSTGFQVTGTGLGLNSNGTTIVGWQWKGGGTGVSNTAGTITSTVSANTTSGFSIVTYTGTGALGTVGHGLGVTPSMIIVKRRNSTGDWAVYNSNLSSPENNQLLLNSTAAAPGSSTFWGNQPSSSVFSVWTSATTNASGGTFVAYCFAPVAGYSAFGSYVGNGSADGPFVFTNFRPRYVMIKRTDSTSDWTIYDTSRSTYNQMNLALYANLSNAEGTTIIVIDTVSNGIKIRNSNADTNASGGTYIYACFAESPFKYALAR